MSPRNRSMRSANETREARRHAWNCKTRLSVRRDFSASGRHVHLSESDMAVIAAFLQSPCSLNTCCDEEVSLTERAVADLSQLAALPDLGDNRNADTCNLISSLY